MVRAVALGTCVTIVGVYIMFKTFHRSEMFLCMF